MDSVGGFVADSLYLFERLPLAIAGRGWFTGRLRVRNKACADRPERFLRGRSSRIAACHDGVEPMRHSKILITLKSITGHGPELPDLSKNIFVIVFHHSPKMSAAEDLEFALTLAELCGYASRKITKNPCL
jgi:hypothetical protein